MGIKDLVADAKLRMDVVRAMCRSSVLPAGP